jgi:type II secretory pathway component GspD/PulD (secretin)
MAETSRGVRALLSLLMTSLLLGGSSSAARAQDPSPAEDGAAIVIGPEGMLITDLMSAVSKASGTPIVWSDQDKAVVTRRVKGPARIPVKDRAFLDTLRSLLSAQEVVLVPMGVRGAEYVYAMDARTLASQFILRVKPTWVVVNEANVEELEGKDGWFVSTVIPVENLENLRDARVALQRLVTANNIGNVQEVPAARAFVVSDFAPNVAAIWRVVRQMDVPTRTPGLKIESFRLAHAKATAVKSLLDGLYPARPAFPVPAQPGLEVAPVGPYVMADEPTNQVFVRASTPDLTAIRGVIQSVDVPPTK